MGMQPKRTCFGGPKQSMAMQIAINASDEHLNADAIKQHTCQTWRDSMRKHKSHNNIFGEESMQRRLGGPRQSMRANSVGRTQNDELAVGDADASKHRNVPKRKHEQKECNIAMTTSLNACQFCMYAQEMSHVVAAIEIHMLQSLH